MVELQVFGVDVLVIDFHNRSLYYSHAITRKEKRYRKKLNMKIFLTAFILLSLAGSLLTSCSTSKNIGMLQVKQDSTALHERDSILRVRKEDSAAYVNIINSMIENQVQFENDCPPCDTADTSGGMIKLPNSDMYVPRPKPSVNKLEYYPDGTLKSAEGRIKAANNKVNVSQQEAMQWKNSYDSLMQVKSKDSTTKKIEVQEKIVTIRKTFIPPWVWIAMCVIAAATWLIRGRFGRA